MYSYRFTSTSNAMQQYYKARHDKKHAKQYSKLSKTIDSRKLANMAKNFIQKFKDKHNKSTIQKFVEWLNK